MILTSALFALSLTTAPVQAAPTLPADFHGRWDLSVEKCAADESGTALTVTATQIIGYEDTSTVKAIHVLDGGSLHVQLHLESADGDRDVQNVIWRSSENGGEWLHIEGDSRPQAVRYARCAAGN